MLVLVKTSAACLFFMLYMAGFYYRKPHIPIKATRIFQWLIAVAVIGNAQEKVRMALDGIRHTIEGNYNKETIDIETKVLAGDSAATRNVCMRNVLSFCTEVGSRLACIDYLNRLLPAGECGFQGGGRSDDV